jgi:hypothetical protein
LSYLSICRFIYTTHHLHTNKQTHTHTHTHTKFFKQEQGGITIIETIEKENLKRNTVAFGGTRVLECAEVALWRLQGREEAAAAAAASASAAEGGTHTHIQTHGKKDGEGGLGLGLLSLSNRFFMFKYGNTPVMELTFDGGRKELVYLSMGVCMYVCIYAASAARWF